MSTLFRFLTEEDQRLLLEKARRLTFQPDEVIIDEGSSRQALFFVHSGHVRVERERLGVPTEVIRLGAGEIFGEMAFVEDRGASASVVADGAVEVDVIEGGYVHALLMSVPGLAARFFQSLAVTLANRLRDTTDRARG